MSVIAAAFAAAEDGRLARLRRAVSSGCRRAVQRLADNDRPAEKLSTPFVHRHPLFHVKQRVRAGVSLWMTACVGDLGSLWISVHRSVVTWHTWPTEGTDPVGRERSNR